MIQSAIINRITTTEAERLQILMLNVSTGEKTAKQICADLAHTIKQLEIISNQVEVRCTTGNLYRCIKTVVMQGGSLDGQAAFVAGRIYKCEQKGCLTNEWNEDSHTINRGFATEHFVEVSS